MSACQLDKVPGFLFCPHLRNMMSMFRKCKWKTRNLVAEMAMHDFISLFVFVYWCRWGIWSMFTVCWFTFCISRLNCQTCSYTYCDISALPPCLLGWSMLSFAHLFCACLWFVQSFHSSCVWSRTVSQNWRFSRTCWISTPTFSTHPALLRVCWYTGSCSNSTTYWMTKVVSMQ